METIQHAAIKTESGYSTVTGKEHAECFRKAESLKIDLSKRASDQGFLTNAGRYVDREEAYTIALAAGQIEKVAGVETGILFSEDLWSPKHGGKFRYAPIIGYCV